MTKVSKKFLEEQEDKLEKKKKTLEQELGDFARKDPRIKGNWKTKFPDFGSRTADPSEQTDQIEAYEATLPVEYVLEEELQKINQALEKIKKGTYGTCKNCKKNIRIKRLKVYPEADICMKCTKIK